MAKRSGLAAVTTANLDFEKRIQRESATVSYDVEFDIFMLRFGKPRRAITEEVADGLNMRLDPKTLKILAFEIVGFRRRFLPAHPDFAKASAMLFGDESLMIVRHYPAKDTHRERAKDMASGLLPLSLGVTGSPRPA
jgi:hypothetical protein